MLNVQYSRRRFLIPVAFLLAGISLKAQTVKYTAGAEIIGGITLLHYKDTTLVAPKRRNKTGFGDEVIVNGYFLFATKQPGLMIKTGLGYAERNIYMNKSGLGDFIVTLFSFGAAGPDSFKIRRVHLQSKYVNIPVGFSFDLTNSPRQRVQFNGGIQFNAGLATRKKAIVDFDETYLSPTPAERAETERMYENTVSGFTLGVQPRIDMDIRIYKGSGIKLGLMPFMLYVKPWNKELAANFFSVASTMGIYYKF